MLGCLGLRLESRACSNETERVLLRPTYARTKVLTYIQSVGEQVCACLRPSSRPTWVGLREPLWVGGWVGGGVIYHSYREKYNNLMKHRPFPR